MLINHSESYIRAHYSLKMLLECARETERKKNNSTQHIKNEISDQDSLVREKKTNPLRNTSNGRVKMNVKRNICVYASVTGCLAKDKCFNFQLKNKKRKKTQNPNELQLVISSTPCHT